MAKKVSLARKLYLDAAHFTRFLLRLSIALVTLGWAGINLYFGIDSMAWPTAPGQILQRTAGNGSTACGSILYKYVVNGAEYTSSHIRFGDFLTWTSEKEFPSSSTDVPVRYNPDFPSMSVLMTGYEKLSVFIPLGIGAFFFVTAGIELKSRYLIR